MLVAASVQGPPRILPPPSPEAGACYIVSEGASGAWAGHSHALAAWTGGGWRFIVPTVGMQAYDTDSGTTFVFRDGTWEAGIVRGNGVVIGEQQVVGERCGSIAGPSGGSVVDVQGRAVIEGILSALRLHGLIET